MRKALIIVLSLLFLSGCPYKYVAKYNYGLDDVEYNNSVVSGAIKSEDGSNVSFTDENMDIVFYVGSDQIQFLLKNKSNATMKLIWDETSYIDSNGGSHKVFHSGIKYNERDQSLPPSIIVKGGNLKDLIAPTDYVYFESGNSGGWRSRDLLRLEHVANDDGYDRLKRITAAVSNLKAFSIYMTLEIGEEKKSYLFPFVLRSAEVLERK